MKTIELPKTTITINELASALTAEDLQAMLDAKSAKWEPEMDGMFWTLDNDGEPYREVWTDSISERCAHLLGLTAPTEDALLAKLGTTEYDRLKAMQAIKDWRDANCAAVGRRSYYRGYNVANRTWYWNDGSCARPASTSTSPHAPTSNAATSRVRCIGMCWRSVMRRRGR